MLSDARWKTITESEFAWERNALEFVRKGLPDVLDMLSVCAEAGLGFDQAMQRVSEYWKTPVGLEFGRVIREMEMGLSRKEALRNLAERLDITELSSFVAVIIQSDELGMSIADTLQSQAKQMREDRRFRAQDLRSILAANGAAPRPTAAKQFQRRKCSRSSRVVMAS